MLTVKNYFETFDFFQLKLLGREKNSITPLGVHDCYPRCPVGPSGFAIGLQTAPRIKIKLI
jgi:hypothetical protein